MTVEVIINVHEITLNERLEDYVTKKVSKLDRYLKILEEAHVDLTQTKSARSASDRQIAQITVRGRGMMLRAEERSDDIYASFDSALEKIGRQIERYKGRRWKKRGDGQTLADLTFTTQKQDQELEDDVQIVRRKQFQLTPMSEEEAILQMELLSHEDFFVFLDDVSQSVNILYRRRDGSLGLIETEVM